MPVSIGADKLSKISRFFADFTVQLQEGKQEKMMKMMKKYENIAILVGSFSSVSTNFLSFPSVSSTGR